ncbi:MAG: nitrogen fixation protein NifH [Actinomycetota bacterium]
MSADPLPWLLEAELPAVRRAALEWLLDEPADSPRVRRARAAAMRSDPIAAILAGQHPDGFWVKPGPGYSPKYTSTVWSLMFLEELGADGRDRRIGRACDYVLSHTQAKNGGFGWQGSSSTAVHCLNGNLLRALIGFGRLDDERVRRSLDWQARSITGEGFDDFHPWATSGPGFRCGINGDLPCAWGAIKALRGLAKVPTRRRTAIHRRAIAHGTEFLLSRDPAVADYPTATKVSANWLKLGFPSAYVADVLQNLEVLAELGHAKHPRLSNAIDLVLSKQDAHGRWRNEYSYRGKLWVDFEPRGGPSRWVTLRACRVLKAALA